MANPTLTKLINIRDNLKDIEQEVADMTSELDNSVIDCECCDRQTWVNREEYELARSIHAAAAQLGKCWSKVNGMVMMARVN